MSCGVGEVTERLEKEFSNTYHQSILPKGRSFTANSVTEVAVLLKGRSSTINSGTQAVVLLGMDMCCSFLLLFARRRK